MFKQPLEVVYSKNGFSLGCGTTAKLKVTELNLTPSYVPFAGFRKTLVNFPFKRLSSVALAKHDKADFPTPTTNMLVGSLMLGNLCESLNAYCSMVRLVTLTPSR